MHAKIIGANPHGWYPYRVGPNTLKYNGETFDPVPECVRGGLYYCEIQDILDYLDYGDRLCIVKPVGQIVAVGDKFKTDKLEITEMMSLKEVDTWKFLIDQGVVMGVKSLQWAIAGGHIDIMKFLIDGEHIDNSRINVYTIHTATVKGMAEIADYLLSKYITITPMGMNYIMVAAIVHGSPEIVKSLVNNHGYDVHVNDDAVLKVAIRQRRNGFISAKQVNEIVEFLQSFN